MSGLPQFFSTADNVTAIFAASYVLWRAGASSYRRTLGSRRYTALSLHSLTPGNPRGLIESLFGQPVYARPRRILLYGDELEQDGVQCLYNARHGWLTVHYREDKWLFRFRSAAEGVTGRGSGVVSLR
jgi:hypothetical protein